MALDDKLDRNWLSSIVFADIVNYSSQSEQVQRKWKDAFNAALSEALKHFPVDERLILDTGDGAAICFLSDPEAALRTTLSIRASFAIQGHDNPGYPRVRLGINLGSVMLLRDLNGNPNAIGDGINVAQRIMSFAEPNQILVSRSYFDVISRHSDDYGRLFRNLGVRQDKHVREHVVYELTTSSGRIASDPPKGQAAPAQPQQTRSPVVAAGTNKTGNRALWMSLGAVACVAVLIGAAVALPRFGREGAAGNAAQPAELATKLPEKTALPAGIPDSKPSVTQERSAAPPQKELPPPASHPVQQARVLMPSKKTVATQAVEQQPRAVEPQQTAVTARHEASAAAPQSQPPQSPEEMEKIQDSLIQLHARADAIRGSVSNLRNQQASDGLQISPEIATAATKLDSYLQAADRAAQNNNPSGARKYMDSAERALSALEAKFGR